MAPTAPRIREFPFGFAPSYRVPALLFGIRETTAVVRVGPDELAAFFGRWSIRTPLSNIASVSVTGPYPYFKTAGPAHLSFADRGLTFASNGAQGVCVTFVHPIQGMDPMGLLHHPNLTVTVADPAGLAAHLRYP